MASLYHLPKLQREGEGTDLLGNCEMFVKKNISSSYLIQKKSYDPFPVDNTQADPGVSLYAARIYVHRDQ